MVCASNLVRRFSVPSRLTSHDVEGCRGSGTPRARVLLYASPSHMHGPASTDARLWRWWEAVSDLPVPVAFGCMFVCCRTRPKRKFEIFQVAWH